MHVIEGDPEKSFFAQNPELRYLPEIKKLINKYEEEKAGFYMWATYLIEDPRSKIYKVPIDNRIDIVFENYLKEKVKTAKVLDLQEIREAYPNIILSKNQVLYKAYADQMDEFNVYTKSLPIKTHADKKIAYLEKMTRMWPTFEKITENMKAEEDANSEVRKGVKESYREKRNTK